MNFRSVPHKFDLDLLQMVYTAVDRIKNVDISEIDLRFIYDAKFGGAFSHRRNELIFCGDVMKMNELDRQFVVYHEMRHMWQFQTRTMLELVDGFEWAPTGQRMTYRQLGSVRSITEYHNLPWEADANGFAWHAMGQYIPENETICESIQYVSMPKEFLTKVRTKAARNNGLQVSSNLSHRSSKRSNKR